jgi:hypothetical protein
MQESMTGIVKLPEDCRRDFSDFTFFIYKDKVKVIDGEQVFDEALDVWTLGEKYCVPEWQNLLFDAMLAYLRGYHLDLSFVRWAAKDRKLHGRQILPLVLDQFGHELATHFNHHATQGGLLIERAVEGLVPAADMLRSVREGRSDKEKKKPGKNRCT